MIYRNLPDELIAFKSRPEIVKHRPWPKITIITVSFNQADFLPECLDSVLSQGYPHLEYIVIDGGSTDGSREILEKHRPHIDRLLIEPDRGQSDGLNKGFLWATGDFMNWINSDDMLYPEALFRVADAFLTYQADLVAGGCYRIDLQKDKLLFNHYSTLPQGTPSRFEPDELLQFEEVWERGDYFFQPEVFFSRNIWLRSGAYLKLHLYYAMDYEMWLRMALAGATIVNIPDVLGYSRVQPGQKTTVGRPYLKQVVGIMEEYQELLETVRTWFAREKCGHQVKGPINSPSGLRVEKIDYGRN